MYVIETLRNENLQKSLQIKLFWKVSINFLSHPAEMAFGGVRSSQRDQKTEIMSLFIARGRRTKEKVSKEPLMIQQFSIQWSLSIID